MCGQKRSDFQPFLTAAAALRGCVAVVLPVEDAVATLEAAVLAAAVVEGLVVTVAGLDVVVAGRDVEGAVAGLGADKIRCSGGIQSLETK